MSPPTSTPPTSSASRSTPVAATPEADDSTAERLLDAAERLFARHGIEGASVRAITQAAGANIASVHYHFGSKLDLVRALLNRRISEMNDRRRPILDAALAKPHVTPLDIASAWVRPLAAVALDRSGADRSYVQFLAVLQSSAPETRSLSAEAFRPQQQRFGELLARALPHVDEPVRWFRFSTAADAAIHALADVDRASSAWRQSGGIPDDRLVDELVDAVAGMLAGAPSTPPDPTKSTDVDIAQTNGGTPS